MQNIYIYSHKEKIGAETIFTQKLLVNFTVNYKEMATNTFELYTRFWSRTKIVFSCKTYSNNLCFIYNFKK